jgi:hypothetical protein
MRHAHTAQVAENVDATLQAAAAAPPHQRGSITTMGRGGGGGGSGAAAAGQRDEGELYKEMLVEFQMEQAKLSREFQVRDLTCWYALFASNV